MLHKKIMQKNLIVLKTGFALFFALIKQYAVGLHIIIHNSTTKNTDLT